MASGILTKVTRDALAPSFVRFVWGVCVRESVRMWVHDATVCVSECVSEHLPPAIHTHSHTHGPKAGPAVSMPRGIYPPSQGVLTGVGLEMSALF